MDTLFEIYDKVYSKDADKYRWWYYSDLQKGYLNYSLEDLFKKEDEAIKNNNQDDNCQTPSCEFIQEIYRAGRKEDYFQELLKELSERSRHMVSAFFLGHYIAHNTSVFDPICYDYHFPWLWFLCCLYHDVFFQNETSHSHFYMKPRYYGFSKGLLYNKETIERYREYRLLNSRCDHGIYAAAALSNYYCKKYYEHFKKGNAERDNLNMDDDTLRAVNCVAKVIASHNIFIAQSNTEIEKYRKAGLEKLIPSETNNCKMPKGKNKYELLYLLLCLVDVLEPIKREVDLHQVSLIVDGNTITMQIDSANNLSDCINYLSNIIMAETWLNYIKIDSCKKDDIIKISITIK